MRQALPADLPGLLAAQAARAYVYALQLTGGTGPAIAAVEEAACRAARGGADTSSPAAFRVGFLRILTQVADERRWEGDLPGQTLRVPAEHERFSGRPGEGPAAVPDFSTDQAMLTIRSLPDECRAATALYFTEDLQAEEIGLVLDLPVEVARARLRRGRRMVMVHLCETAGKAIGVSSGDPGPA